MVEPRKRTKSLSKKTYKTPGKNTAKSYVRRKTTSATCSACGKRLQGVNTKKSASKTRKRPGRAFSGSLCHSCTQTVMKYKARVETDQMHISRVPVKYQKFLK